MDMAVRSPLSATVELARTLIGRRSLTPDDGGCQALIGARLLPLGFECETLFVNGVTNLWARRGRAHPRQRIARPTVATERLPDTVADVALFTRLAEAELAELADTFQLGALRASQSIAAGTINSNFDLETERGRWFVRRRGRQWSFRWSCWRPSCRAWLRARFRR